MFYVAISLPREVLYLHAYFSSMNRERKEQDPPLSVYLQYKVPSNGLSLLKRNLLPFYKVDDLHKVFELWIHNIHIAKVIQGLWHEGLPQCTDFPYPVWAALL